MMQTPNTPEGYVAELVCARIRKKLPELPPRMNNPIYSAVLETLNEYLPTAKKIERPLSRDEFLALAGRR